MVLGAGLGSPAEVIARGLPGDVELAGLALHADLRLRPVTAGDVASQAGGGLGDGFLTGVGLGDGFSGLKDGDQGRFVARLCLSPVFDRRTASWAILGKSKEPADLLRGSHAQLVGEVEPGPDSLTDAGGLQCLSGDMNLVGEVDHIGLPAFLEEFLRVGLEFGLHLGGGGLDLDQVEGVTGHADDVGTGHQAADREGCLVQGAVAGLDLGERPRGGVGMAFLRDEHVFAGVIHPHQLLEHVAPTCQLLHILVAIRLTRQCRLSQRMLQFDRTRQPQFEEGFGEGRDGHWPRYSPQTISANVQIGAELLCKGANVKSEIGLGLDHDTQ